MPLEFWLLHDDTKNNKSDFKYYRVNLSTSKDLRDKFVDLSVCLKPWKNEFFRLKPCLDEKHHEMHKIEIFIIFVWVLNFPSFCRLYEMSHEKRISKHLILNLHSQPNAQTVHIHSFVYLAICTTRALARKNKKTFPLFSPPRLHACVLLTTLKFGLLSFS